MLFNSIEYLIFLPVVFLLYRALGHRAQNYMLLLASYFFYGWWDVRFLFLIAISTSLDFICGLLIRNGALTPRERRIPLLWAIGSAFFFVTIDWRAGSIGEGFSSRFGWLVFAGTAALTLAANFLLPLASRLEEDARRRLFVLLSVAGNLGILGVFKYFNFFVDSAVASLDAIGLQGTSYHLNIVLPVGISFYTFQTMSYTIDIYRRTLEPTDRFLDFALFVSFFPQLVAGPIERAAHLLPELSRPRNPTSDQTWRGLHLIAFGLFKKVAIADGVAPTVNQIFGRGVEASWAEVIVGSVLFAIQIYCDFSAYSDIARGTSKLLGIELMLNFDQPYFSRSASEFWRRWHISLSSWLRDYLYISLGGNRIGESKTYRNLMATMVIGGLWHGAAWNFVLWGAYQGSVLIFGRVKEHLWPRRGFRRSALGKMVSICIFFGITCYGWLLFRGESLDQIVAFTHTLLFDFGNLSFEADPPRLAALLGIPFLAAIEFAQYGSGDERFYGRLPVPLQGAMYALMLFVLILGTSNEPAEFIYFAF